MRIMGHGVSCPTIENPLIRFSWAGILLSSFTSMSDCGSSMNDLRFRFFLSSGVTITVTSGLWDAHEGGSLAILLFKIFSPFGITHDFEASLLGVFLHSAMSTVEVALSFLSRCDGLHPCPCSSGLFLTVKPIPTSPNDVFSSLLVVSFRIWSRAASLGTVA